MDLVLPAAEDECSLRDDIVIGQLYSYANLLSRLLSQW
jgi:hypothetical protein